ncbi:type II secretion system F family protein [Modestobacter sp. I12A-02662]|uniref:type II secretion system F family protein n=1 Tax=Modestobacter sp. I12A-02662 TaxID=1730496 RepID=UPI0034DF31ED
MTAPALLALAGALLLWVPPGAARHQRLASLLPRPPRGDPVPADRPPPPGPRRRWSLAGMAGLALFGLLDAGPAAAVLAAGVVVGVERLLRRTGAAPDTGARLHRDLPVACDLLAVCLAAGTPVGAALTVVADAVAGPLGDHLVRVGGLYGLGASPRRAWAGTPPPADALARALVRAGESGSAVVPALQRLAADLRATDRSRTEAAVRSAGVWVLAPLGLCFLPAFLCLGVVPLVLGIAADVF